MEIIVATAVFQGPKKVTPFQVVVFSTLKHSSSNNFFSCARVPAAFEVKVPTEGTEEAMRRGRFFRRAMGCGVGALYVYKMYLNTNTTCCKCYMGPNWATV